MRRLALVLIVVSTPIPSASAQDVDALDLAARIAFYGDNTEFSNPFREGETLFGTFAEVFLEATLSDRLSVRAGAFGNQRFGSEDAFDEARPILALIIGGPRSRLVFGTLQTVTRVDGPGPDRTGPHGLLPPIQRETLAFERPWEAGVQWLVDVPRVRQDAWLNWQRVNDRAQRERFDAGLVTRVELRRALALRGQIHVVHEGGQLGGVGPVADSVATGLGVEVDGPVDALDRVTFDAHALVSRYVPDRERDANSRTGVGGFIRASVEEAGWRVHGILWRACDFIKVEGDPQYQSLRRDGTIYRGLRDYAEAGLTKTFTLARASSLEASARWHRVENDYEYSFRLLAVVHLRRRLL